MIRRKCIQKIFRTTICLFLILVVSTITNLSSKTTPVMVNIEDVTMLGNTSIYLLNENGYFVKKPVYLSSEDLDSNVRKIISYLKKGNCKYTSFRGLLEDSVEILNVYYDEYYLTIDLSCDFYDSSDLNSSVISIVYSLMEFNNIKGVTILVEGDYLKDYPRILDKSISINPKYEITSRDDVSKIVIYYLLNEDGENYYVPVTKYLNDSRDKINILIDELASNSSMDLVSVVNRDLELINSSEENDVFILNFNHALFDSSNKVLEEVLYCISYSVFDNYDVSMVLFEVEGENVANIEKKSL